MSSVWECICDCGRRKLSNLRSARSCGCLRRARNRKAEQFFKEVNGRKVGIRAAIIEWPDGRQLTLKETIKLLNLSENGFRNRMKTQPREKWFRRKPDRLPWPKEKKDEGSAELASEQVSGAAQGFKEV
jgi:hypothetical protein